MFILIAIYFDIAGGGNKKRCEELSTVFFYYNDSNKIKNPIYLRRAFCIFKHLFKSFITTLVISVIQNTLYQNINFLKAELYGVRLALYNSLCFSRQESMKKWHGKWQNSDWVEIKSNTCSKPWAVQAKKSKTFQMRKQLAHIHNS